MTAEVKLFVRQSLMFSLLAAACWAVLTANQGWGFFAVLWLGLMLWLYRNPLSFPKLRWRYIPAFLWFFLRQLFLGAIDVARRALLTGAGENHGWAEYPTKLSQAHNRQLLATLISLLPGTCSASVAASPANSQSLSSGWLIQLHLLDTTLHWQQDVARLEWHLARLMADEPLLRSEVTT